MFSFLIDEQPLKAVIFLDLVYAILWEVLLVSEIRGRVELNELSVLLEGFMGFLFRKTEDEQNSIAHHGGGRAEEGPPQRAADKGFEGRAEGRRGGVGRKKLAELYGGGLKGKGGLQKESGGQRE